MFRRRTLSKTIKRNRTRAACRRFALEPLENRRMLALIGHWQLEEDPAVDLTSIVDAGPNSHDGTLFTSDGATNKSVAGAFAGSKAIDFDGTNDQIAVGLGGDLPTGNEERTITAWVNSTAGVDKKFFGYGDDAPGSQFRLSVENISLTPHVVFRHSSGSIRFPDAAIGSWMHVAAVVPAGATTTDDVKVYINGVEKTGVRNSGSDQTLNTINSTFEIGGVDGEVTFFDGAIDDVQFYDTALSAGQISSLLNNPGTTATTPVDFVVDAATTQTDLDGIIILTGSFLAQDLINTLDINLPNITFVGQDFIVLNTDTDLIDAANLDEVVGSMAVDGNGNATEIGLGNVTSAGGSVSVSGNGNATEIGLGSIATIGGNMNVDGNGNATEIGLGSVTTIDGNMSVSGNGNATEIGLGSLTTVGGDMRVDNNDGATSFDLSSLNSVGGDMSVDDNDGATSFDLTSLTTVGGNASMSGNTSASSANMPSLTTVGGDFNLIGNIAVLSIDLPALTDVGGDVTVDNNGSATTFELPNMTNSGGGVSVSNNGALTTIELPNMVSAGGSVSVANNGSTTTFELPNMTEAGGISVSNNGAMTTFDLPNMTDINGDATITDNASLTNLDISSLTEVFGNLTLLGNISLSVTNAPSLESVGGDVTLGDTILDLLGNDVEVGGDVHLMDGGGLSGEGSVEANEVTNTAGTVSPGNLAGLLTLVGVYRHQADALLAIELAGTQAEVEHDVLMVDGSVILEGGTLKVELIDNFLPELGDSFTILSTNSLTGTFTTEMLPAGFEWDVDYSSLGVTLNVVGVADPGFSFVDVDNNGIFGAGDVALTNGEVEDGRFDTGHREGNYTQVIHGAGLVINGPDAGLEARRFQYKADGNVLVNTSLTTDHWSGTISVHSRDASVVIGDVSLTSRLRVSVWAGDDIELTDSAMHATGRHFSHVQLSAGGHITAQGAAILASSFVHVRAYGNVSFTTGQEASSIQASGPWWSTVLVSAGADLDVSGSSIQANKRVDLHARDSFFAQSAQLLATDRRHSSVTIRSGGDLDLSSATVRASQRIDIRSRDGDVDLVMASIGITGGRRGDIYIKGNRIDVDEATILAPDVLDLIGQLLGDPNEIGKGTLPLP